MKKKSVLTVILCALLCFGITFLVCRSEILFSADKLITDPLYQRPGVPDNRIVILAIDEKTIAAYGDPSDWSREIPARLVRLLNADPDSAPAVIAFDMFYVSERDPEGDAAFAEACAEGGNVITAVNVVIDDYVYAKDGGIGVDHSYVKGIEYPYPALREAADYGAVHANLDKDNYARYSRTQVEYEGETIWSLPVAVGLKYAERTGETFELPKTSSEGYFEFAYSGIPGRTYEVLSLCDVLEGVKNPDLTGCIVFVGAYAPGMQDEYHVPIQRGKMMYGVEIHANTLEAMMEGRTALRVKAWCVGIAAGLIAALYYLISKKLKIVPAAILGVGLIGLCVVAARLLYTHGYSVKLIEVILAILIIYVVQLVTGYIAEILRKRKILHAFRQYVAPEVVREVAEKGDFKIALGGEKRHVAVLFVDIRGFTPMSEGLQPEQVVEILNEYLTLTTKSIFKNGGTLDKFIGDATMAVFNAPFDLDDYIYRAVCTARDIAAGSEELEKKLMERFGRSVSFGIGVNCGDAVVGNIGCDFRMDYTAIGDTVNTAARLESKAGRGQILISSDVYEAVKDRVSVTDVGVIPLKGKSNEVYVYQLDEVR